MIATLGCRGCARWWPAGVVALTLVLLCPQAAMAAPGDPDTTFGTGGKTTLNFGGTDRATHVVATPDGRFVAIGSTDATGSGDFAVARFTAAGAPDPTFGSGGKVTAGTSPGSTTSAAAWSSRPTSGSS